MVHFLRNALAHVPKHAQGLVATTIRTVFAEFDPARARAQWRHVADGFRDRFDRLATCMDEAEDDVLAYLAFPPEHWRQIWSTNPQERLNREVKRRSDVVGIFPNPPALLRLVGAILSEQHDEWQTGRRYLSAESLAKLALRGEEVPRRSWPPASGGSTEQETGFRQIRRPLIHKERHGQTTLRTTPTIYTRAGT